MIDTDKYEGHSTGWRCKVNHSTYSIINEDGHKVASIGACADVWKDTSNKDSLLIEDAPYLLEQVKRLTKTLELIGKNMPFDSWLHTLIKEVIGYEKWQAKEMIE